MTPCPHCGALPSGELFGYPVVVHAKDCPNCPKPFVETDIPYIMGQLQLTPMPRFMCLLCKSIWNEPREENHTLGCPANPLTN